MPRGVYKRKNGKDKVAKKSSNKKTQQINYGTQDYEITGTYQGPAINLAAMGARKSELDVLSDMLSDFEALTEDAKFRIMAFFVHKYNHYAPNGAASSR